MGQSGGGHARLREVLRSPEHQARLRESAARMSREHVTHGLSGHPLYGTHTQMMARCYNPGSPDYRDYGARGIRVCPQWHDVAKFIAWIEVNLGPRPDGMSLDRIDNDGNYEPGKVRWATAREQRRNQRRRTGSRQEAVTAPDTPMSCPTCGAEVASEAAFDRHYRKTHRQPVPP